MTDLIPYHTPRASFTSFRPEVCPESRFLMKRYRPRASFSVFTPEVHTTNHQRFQKKVDISHNLQYLCTPNQKVYHLQHPRGIPERNISTVPSGCAQHPARTPAERFSVPSPMQKARMAESVDALVSNTSGAIRAGSIPAPGTKQNASAWFSNTCIFLFPFCTTVAPPNGLFWAKFMFF